MSDWGKDVFPTTGSASEWNFMVGCACETTTLSGPPHGHPHGHGHGHGHHGGHGHGHGRGGGGGTWYGPAIVPEVELYTFEDFVASVEDDAARRLLANTPANERAQLVSDLNAIRQSELAGRLPQGTLAKTLNELARKASTRVSGAVASPSTSPYAVPADQHSALGPTGRSPGPWADLRQHHHHMQFGAAPVDNWPPSDRPDFLKPYTHVSGVIQAAPTDLPSRTAALEAELTRRGWTVGSKRVGTDFEGPNPWLGPLNLPVPKDQPADYLIHRTDRAYTPEEAQQAFAESLAAIGLNYSPIAAWAGEISTYVVQPTVTSLIKKAQDVGDAIPKPSTLVPILIVSGIGLAALYVAMMAKAHGAASGQLFRGRE